MNQLPIEKQIMIASMLVEGNSIRSIERVTNVHRDTIMRLGIRIGERARVLSDNFLRDIKCNFLQVDEIWCYVGKKNKRLNKSERIYSELGDQYIFVAIDAETKLVPHYEIGKRTQQTATNFLQEVNRRITSRFQLTTDSFPGYSYPVETILRYKADYAQLHKVYDENPESEKRYSPAKIIRIVVKPIIGKPKIEHISTSYVERQNLTMRMNIRRLTRLTNAFSKKLYNLQCAIDLHFFYYNFMRVHQSLRVTPAMQSGITKHLWNWNDFFNKGSLKKVA